MVIPMCKIKPISPYLKISMQIKNFVKMSKDSNRKCNWHFLTPPQGKVARRGGWVGPR